MLNIIQKGYTKILKLFYAKKTSIHLREIAKQTGLNENSVYRFLNKLEGSNVLSSYKKGNMRFFSLKKSKKVYLILSYFDIERYDKLPIIRKKAVETYLNFLPEQPIFVILFGSTAKNTYRDDSDIDMLIITNRRIDTKEAEREADIQTGIKVSSFQMVYNDFIKELRLKDDMVVQSALETGYPLINHIKYYEDINSRNSFRIFS